MEALQGPEKVLVELPLHTATACAPRNKWEGKGREGKGREVIKFLFAKEQRNIGWGGAWMGMLVNQPQRSCSDRCELGGRVEDGSVLRYLCIHPDSSRMAVVRNNCEGGEQPQMQRQEERKTRRKEERKKGRKEERKKGRKEERKKGRKEERKAE